MSDLTPRAFVLRSYANSGLPWWKAIAELVDNSINADCNRVVIEVKNRVLTVSDDGSGAKDILALFRLGDDQHKRGNSMYGIGAKDAWLSCSDNMSVETTHRGTRRSMAVNIDTLIANNWQGPDPEVTEGREQSGTVITLPIRKDRNVPSEDAFSMLAWVFSPAIKSGKQILVINGRKRKALLPVEMPARDDIVASEFGIDGKQVTIDIGILPEGKAIERGPFWLIHKHRILEGTSIGAGSYSVRRLAGTITLGDGWKIGKNKDCLTEEADRLKEAIFVRIEGILAKASSLSESIESELLRTELQQLINDALNDANKSGREKRKPKSRNTGSVEPAGSGKKRRRARVVHHTGDATGLSVGNGRTTGGFQFDWCDMQPETIGMFDHSGGRVYLNEANPFVAAIKAEDNRKAILCCVMGLIADEDCRRDERGNGLLKFSYKNFAEAIGKLLNERESKERANAKSAV